MAIDEAVDAQEVPLSGRLAEFRTALRHEIDAARRNESSSAVSLVNGRRISQLASSFQYLFEAENLLNLPSDTPGDLYVPGSAPLQVEVVSVDGMTITLRVFGDLGAFVPSARLQSNMAFLLRKLIERIENLSGKPTPVSDRVLDPHVSGSREIGSRVEGVKLNREQGEALASSLGFNATFILGPPGTGKTNTIGAIAAELCRRKRSVLLVSHTNTAVDQALLKIRPLADPSEIQSGKVIRVGDPSDEELAGYPDLLARTHVERRSEELVNRRNEITETKEAAVTRAYAITGDIELWEWVQDAHDDIDEMTAEFSEVAQLEDDLSRKREEYRAISAQLPYWDQAARAASAMEEILKHIPGLEQQLTTSRSHLATGVRERDTAQRRLDAATSLHAEVSSMGWLKRRWKALPSPEEQQSIVAECQTALSLRQDLVDREQRAANQTEQSLADRVAEIDAFTLEYNARPEDVQRQAKSYTANAGTLSGEIQRLDVGCRERRSALSDVLGQRISALRDYGLVDSEPRTIADMLTTMLDAYDKAYAQVSVLPIEALRTERRALSDQIESVDRELQGIEEQLQRVEEIIIAEATVVATTLTRAYLRDSIQARTFDTVILDEASMAPIPSLWVAASLATANVVVTGDDKQLPPIVISDHPMAIKWLGHDVFEVAGASEENPEKPYIIMLKEQYRMHPAISAIANGLIYNGRLRDTEGIHSDEFNNTLSHWYRYDWGHDHPVLLVDTGSLNAWVTSVSRGKRSSRLNFLSATICTDIAELMLKEGREESGARKPRILIACPYRPHAQLLQLLIDGQGIRDDVTAGTTHTFQGSEADAVIFDMVNDDPHWRVAMFTPEHDDVSRRLLNVALTRAKRRLIIVGDFTYNAKQGRKAFLGKSLIPFLLDRYPLVDAKEIIPAGFANRAADVQARVVGGAVEADAARLVVTQERFYPLLAHDIKNAGTRIVIYSAFITQDRLTFLEPQLQAACERGVSVCVVTKGLDERRADRHLYRTLEDALRGWGVTVVHKRGMHEKLVFVDDEIHWVGSLNPLSFRNTQELMERRTSRAVVDDYKRQLHLDDLVGEYEQGQPACPICGSEIVASEGKDAPFYWRCVVDGCYSRGIDQPRIDGGVMVCANCGGPVEFGTWGEKPAWRCTSNRHHHQEIVGTHLRLPAMREIIPRAELRKLDRDFGSQPIVCEPHTGQQRLF